MCAATNTSKWVNYKILSEKFVEFVDFVIKIVWRNEMRRSDKIVHVYSAFTCTEHIEIDANGARVTFTRFTLNYTFFFAMSECNNIEQISETNYR